MTLLYCGIPPSEIDAMPVGDLLLFLETLPLHIRLHNALPPE